MPESYTIDDYKNFLSVLLKNQYQHVKVPEGFLAKEVVEGFLAKFDAKWNNIRDSLDALREAFEDKGLYVEFSFIPYLLLTLPEPYPMGEGRTKQLKEDLKDLEKAERTVKRLWFHFTELSFNLILGQLRQANRRIKEFLKGNATQLYISPFTYTMTNLKPPYRPSISTFFTQPPQTTRYINIIILRDHILQFEPMLSDEAQLIINGFMQKRAELDVTKSLDKYDIAEVFKSERDSQYVPPHFHRTQAWNEYKLWLAYSFDWLDGNKDNKELRASLKNLSPGFIDKLKARLVKISEEEGIRDPLYKLSLHLAKLKKEEEEKEKKKLTLVKT